MSHGWCRSRTRSADADLRLARAYLTTSVYHPRAADRSRTDEPAVYETAALPTELQQRKCRDAPPVPDGLEPHPVTTVISPTGAVRIRTRLHDTPVRRKRPKLSARLELATAPLPRGCAATCAMTAETGSGGTRTLNRMGKNQLLCQLSYEPENVPTPIRTGDSKFNRFVLYH